MDFVVGLELQDQVVAGSGERNTVKLVVGLLVVKDTQYRKCDLEEEESAIHISCGCDALAVMRQRVLCQAYSDATKIGEAELRFC